MKLKNNALQELYDTLMSGIPTISPYAESPIDKDFRECDEELQKDIDIWKCGNDILLSANTDLANIKKKLEKENGFLKEDISKLKEHISGIHKTLNDVISERDDAKVRLHFLTHSRDDWKRRVEHAEDAVEDLKKENTRLEQRLMELKETLEKANTDRTELQNDRDFYHGLYTEHRRDYDKLFEENKQIKKELHTAEEARNNLRAELEAKVKRMDEITKDRDFFFKMYHALKNDYKKLEAKYRDMKSYSNCYAEGYSDGKEEGEENLWDMLQNVRDVKPEEFDPECETLNDIIDMDLEDFLDSYKKWKEEKETDRMRKWLADFCDGRLCKECPLGSTEFKCGCGYSFIKRDRFDTRIIPDEDIKRYYEKARGCGRYTLKNGKLFVDNKSYTMEATVEINKDLLEKVCGIKPDEEAHKLHKLEYGDAVRLPWRDYDYMYIGPDEKEETVVRMFDPKNHAIATSHIGNVRYSGYKIILTSEEDLRKIWKDKK